MVIKIGLIGYRNHASRLLNLLSERTDSKIMYVYHPTKSISDSRITNNLSDLFNCDAIIIAAPNAFHYYYIEKIVENFKGYVLCEKPPVTSYDEINELEKLETDIKSRLYFNFNYRFSEINRQLACQLHSDEIGKIIHVNIVSNHGLAFKNNYVNSWRADGSKNLHNIAETVSIHYLDILNLHFGNIEKVSYYANNISKNGTSYDTSYFSFQYRCGITASILNSYASPYLEEIMLIGTNGYFTIRNNELTVFSPRDTFDSNGFSISPPITKRHQFLLKEDYDASLKKSLDYFISHVKEKRAFDITQFNTSLSTNKIILDLTKG